MLPPHPVLVAKVGPASLGFSPMPLISQAQRNSKRISNQQNIPKHAHTHTRPWLMYVVGCCCVYCVGLCGYVVKWEPILAMMVHPSPQQIVVINIGLVWPWLRQMHDPAESQMLTTGWCAIEPCLCLCTLSRCSGDTAMNIW